MIKNKISPYINIVNILIIINIVVFIVSNIVDLRSLFALYFPKNINFHLWQFFSHLFMHGGITHLLFNMFALWMFATPLEKILRKKYFLFFYFACGVGGSLIYTAINLYQFNGVEQLLINAHFTSQDIQTMLDHGQYPPSILSEAQAKTLLSLYLIPTVGASGAIYGILVVYAFIFPNNKLLFLFFPVPIAAKYFIPALLTFDLFSGITNISLFGDGIAHFAHIGGAIIGFLFVLYWLRKH